MKIELPYLGDRNYVHGGTIVNMVLERLQPAFPLEIKFHKPIRGVIAVRSTADDSPSATVSFSHDGKRVSYGLFDLGGGDLNNRVPQNEADIAKQCSLQDRTIRCLHGADVSLIARILVMNKTLMASVFPGAKGKWWFASLVADAWPPDAREVELAFDGGLGTRLTRSIVKVDGNSIAKLYFSLVPA
jgi:hypothetical protein